MTIEELYKKIEGSYEEAKGRLMNDILIKRFVLKFANEYTLDKLIEAYNNHDNAGVFEAAHSFKGVCGNLAFTKLFNFASALTEKTRGVDNTTTIDIAKEYEDFVAEFNKTVQAIKEYETSL